MKHLLQILKENGYESWRYSFTFPSQNANAKMQNDYILKNKDKYNVVFVNGDDKKGSFYFQNGLNDNDFSTNRVGGLATHFVKDNNFDNAIIWGLREADKPPTLINYRPKIKLTKLNLNNEIITLNESQDDAINYCLSVENHELIFKDIFKKELSFDYNLIKNPTN
jgi:hypothetical protein